MNYLSQIMTISLLCANCHANSTFPSTSYIIEHTFVTSQGVSNYRLLVQNLAQNNPRVLAQFDEFASTLEALEMSSSDKMRIWEGVKFSAEKHQKQTRHDPENTPYIIHPLGVANYIMAIGQVHDADIILGALLHDTVEDTDTTPEEIENLFGTRVAGFVQEVTDNKALPKQVRKDLQIKNAPHKSEGATQIKLADKLYNLQDLERAPPTNWDQKRIDAYFEWAKQVVNALPSVNPALKSAVDRVIETHEHAAY